MVVSIATNRGLMTLSVPPLVVAESGGAGAGTGAGVAFFDDPLLDPFFPDFVVGLGEL